MWNTTTISLVTIYAFWLTGLLIFFGPVLVQYMRQGVASQIQLRRQILAEREDRYQFTDEPCTARCARRHARGVQ